jgi:AbrB family looped-hinge helix DNA binding protein
MYASTITSKGQTTIPKEIRKLLQLKFGDRIEFIVELDGRVYIYPLNVDVRSLSGILHKKDREPVSVAEMDAAVGKAVAEELMRSRGELD